MQRKEKESASSDSETADTKKPKASAPRWSLKNWISFLNERAPPLVFFLLAVTPAASIIKLVEGSIDWEKLAWSSIGYMSILLTLRVMDDVKDYETDKICHPDRPLPRGSMAYDEVCKAILGSGVFMMVYGAIMGWRYEPFVGAIYCFCVLYLYLMYVEFGIGEVLSKSPLIYAITHQVLIYFGTMFQLTLSGIDWNDPLVLKIGSVAFSGFFTYEVCRKLDPTHLKIKGTYLVIYGRTRTFLITVVLVAIGAVSSHYVGCHYVTWPIEILLVTSLLLLFLVMPSTYPPNTKPKMHKPVEAIAIFYVLLHFSAPLITAFFL